MNNGKSLISSTRSKNLTGIKPVKLAPFGAKFQRQAKTNSNPSRKSLYPMLRYNGMMNELAPLNSSTRRGLA